MAETTGAVITAANEFIAIFSLELHISLTGLLFIRLHNAFSSSFLKLVAIVL